MVIPKGDSIINGLSEPQEIEQFFKKQFGHYNYSGHAGGSFSKTNYFVQDRVQTQDHFLKKQTRNAVYQIRKHIKIYPILIKIIRKII